MSIITQIAGRRSLGHRRAAHAAEMILALVNMATRRGLYQDKRRGTMPTTQLGQGIPMIINDGSGIRRGALEGGR